MFIISVSKPGIEDTFIYRIFRKVNIFILKNEYLEFVVILD